MKTDYIREGEGLSQLLRAEMEQEGEGEDKDDDDAEEEMSRKGRRIIDARTVNRIKIWRMRVFTPDREGK